MLPPRQTFCEQVRRIVARIYITVLCGSACVGIAASRTVVAPYILAAS